MQNKNKIKLQLLNFEQINSINKSFDILEKGIRRITHKDLLLSIKKKFEKLNSYNTERLKILLFKIFSKNNITRIKILSKYFNRFKYNYYNSQIYNHKNNNLSLKLRNCLNIYNHSLLRKTKLKYFFLFWRYESKNKIKNETKSNDKEIINKININSKFNEEIKRLNTLLNEEKNKCNLLNNKIKDLEKICDKDYIIKLCEKIILKDEEIKELKSKLPFEISKGEKLMSVIFISTNQKINYSIICKNTDIFNILVNKLYEKYPEYKRPDNFFICNGKKVDEYQSLEKNEIEDSGVIILNKLYL